MKAPEGCHLSQKILIAAAYSKAEVKVEVVTREKKGYTVEGSPLKKVPVLQTEAGVLFESNAIARYGLFFLFSSLSFFPNFNLPISFFFFLFFFFSFSVAKQNGNPASLFGLSAVEAAQVDSWVTFASTEVEAPVNSWVWTAEGKLPANPALVKAASSDCRKLLSSLDQVLKTKTFLVGERISLADVVVACALIGGFRAVFDGKLRKPFKNVCRWFVTVVNQEEVANVVGAVTLAGDKKACNASVAPEVAAAPVAAVVAPAAAVEEPAAEEKKEVAEEEDDFDVFGDDDDDEEHEAEIQRIADAAAAAKAAKGKVVIAKSVVVLDVKPWDTETDLKALEDKIRGIEMEGLEWKNAELKPVAYGLKKIVIMCHIVDTQVSVDDLQDKIGEFDDDVQSTDVVTFTKL